MFLLAGAAALFALAVVPLHSFLDAQAGHHVIEATVHTVQTRAAVCGALVLLMAIATNVIAIALAVILATNALRRTSRDDFIDDPALRDIPRIAAAIRALPAGARILVTPPLDAPVRLYAGAEDAKERIVAYPFDSDANAVRAALAAAPHRYFVACASARGTSAYEQLALPYVLAPATRFPHAVLFELRSR